MRNMIKRKSISYGADGKPKLEENEAVPEVTAKTITSKSPISCSEVRDPVNNRTKNK
jgi:hypothetical protein